VHELSELIVPAYKPHEQLPELGDIDIAYIRITII
jgi:hypothetical protein